MQLNSGRLFEVGNLKQVMQRPVLGIVDILEWLANAIQHGLATSVLLYQFEAIFCMINRGNKPVHGKALLDLLKLGKHKNVSGTDKLNTAAYGCGAKYEILQGDRIVLVSNSKLDKDGRGKISWTVTGEYSNADGERENAYTMIEFDIIKTISHAINIRASENAVTYVTPAMMNDLNNVLGSLFKLAPGVFIFFLKNVYFSFFLMVWN